VNIDEQLDWPTFLASISLLQVAVVVCALWVIWRLLVKFWPFLRKLMATVDAIQQIPAMSQQIKDIHHEVHFNNGSSVKDAVTRMEQSIVILNAVHGIESPVGPVIVADRSTLEKGSIDEQHRN